MKDSNGTLILIKLPTKASVIGKTVKLTEFRVKKRTPLDNSGTLLHKFHKA